MRFFPISVLIVAAFPLVLMAESHLEKSVGAHSGRESSGRPTAPNAIFIHTVKDSSKEKVISPDQLASLKALVVSAPWIEIKEDSGVVSICDKNSCSTFKNYEKAKKYIETKIEKGKKGFFKATIKEMPKKEIVSSPVVPDLSGRAYTVDGMDHLLRVIQRNRAAGITSRVIFSAHNCGPCQNRRPGFLQEAVTAPANVRYYIYEIPDYNTGIAGNALMGGNITSFPTERDL